MEILTMEVSPKMAAELLERNASNRPLRPSHVSTLAGIMAKGQFQTTHQGIALNKEGEVIDGQHRLAAIIKSGVTVTMPVAFGVDASDYRALMIDVGLNRTTSDLYAVDRFVAQPSSFIAYLHTSLRHKAFLAPYIDAFGPIMTAISTGGRHMRKGVTAAPVIAAAAIRVAMGEDVRMVNANFAGMAKLDYEHLPPVANALLRQIANGVVNRGDKWDLFVRAMRVFDASTQQNTKIQVKDASDLLAKTREFVGWFINNPEAIKAAHERVAVLTQAAAPESEEAEAV